MTFATLGAITDTGPEVAARCEKKLEQDLKDVDLKDREYRKRVVKNGAGCAAAGFCSAYTGGTAAGACEWAAREIAGPLYDGAETIIKSIGKLFGGGEEIPENLVVGPSYTREQVNAMRLDTIAKANFAYISALKMVAAAYNEKVLPYKRVLGYGSAPMTPSSAEMELYKSLPARNDNLEFSGGDPANDPLLKRDLVGHELWLVSGGAERRIPVHMFRGSSWDAPVDLNWLFNYQESIEPMEVAKWWTRNIATALEVTVARIAAESVAYKTRAELLQGKVPEIVEAYRRRQQLLGLGVVGVGAVAAVVIWRRSRR